MDKSSQLDIPLETQREAWNKWNTNAREGFPLTETNQKVKEVIDHWIRLSNRKNLYVSRNR